jgi:predicted XRE-type DNA-binding protein
MTDRFESIWDALEDTPAEAENMKLRSSVMIALKTHVQTHKMTQTQAAQLFGVTQPRISDLLRGKIDLFSLDSLINMAAAAGLQVELRVTQPAAA